MYKIPWIKKVCLIKDELQQKQATLAQEFYSINSAISVYTLAAMNHIEAFASNRYFFYPFLFFSCVFVKRNCTKQWNILYRYHEKRDCIYHPEFTLTSKTCCNLALCVQKTCNNRYKCNKLIWDWWEDLEQAIYPNQLWNNVWY